MIRAMPHPSGDAVLSMARRVCDSCGATGPMYTCNALAITRDWHPLPAGWGQVAEGRMLRDCCESCRRAAEAAGAAGEARA